MKTYWSGKGAAIPEEPCEPGKHDWDPALDRCKKCKWTAKQLIEREK